MSIVRVCAVGLIAVGASGAEPEQEGSGLVRVDQGLADVHPLAASLRADTAVHPVHDDFVNVYQDPEHPGQYIRSSGAIHAVFPHSTYALIGGSVQPTVPAGTVYHFGRPMQRATLGAALDLTIPDGTSEPTSEPIGPERIVHAMPERPAVDPIRPQRVDEIAQQPPRRTQREAQLTMSDELYRRERLREIASR